MLWWKPLEGEAICLAHSSVLPLIMAGRPRRQGLGAAAHSQEQGGNKSKSGLCWLSHFPSAWDPVHEWSVGHIRMGLRTSIHTVKTFLTDVPTGQSHPDSSSLRISRILGCVELASAACIQPHSPSFFSVWQDRSQFWEESSILPSILPAYPQLVFPVVLWLVSSCSGGDCSDRWPPGVWKCL